MATPEELDVTTAFTASADEIRRWANGSVYGDDADPFAARRRSIIEIMVSGTLPTEEFDATQYGFDSVYDPQSGSANEAHGWETDR